ncbi:MAG: hypothetical protein V3T61_01595 [Acidobacteriota bacterium]
MRRATCFCLCVAAAYGCLAASPLTSWAGIEGDWGVQIIEVVKKFSASNPDFLRTKIVVEYRYDGGIPPEPFWVALAISPQALPQTVREYSSPVWDLPEAIVFEVCPHQFERIEVGEQNIGRGVETVGRGFLTLERSVDFRTFSGTQFETRGIPSPEVIVHDWGNRYDGLGDVSALTFGKSLEDLVLSASWMTQANGRCEGVSAAECVDIIFASIRSLEPTTEQFERGIHQGETFVRCPEAKE